LIFVQFFVPRVVEQHSQVDQLCSEIVDERGVLVSPDRSYFEVGEGLIWIE
jgi:hypothetical protein